MREIDFVIYPSGKIVHSGYDLRFQREIIDYTFDKVLKRTDVLLVASSKEVQRALLLINLGLSKHEIEELLKE